ncbi:MAG: phosphopantetheine-binding protein [Bacteroidales bacterium]|jgi:acyl carrier protein|nr:phosphopantetheine-binding protein [Bacteroidales bacterium]
MDKQELINKINDILSDEFEVSKDKISPDASLMSTLDLDSLDLVDIVVLVEKNFGFVMKKEDFSGIKTFNDFYSFVFSRLETD